jgi:hypothetical protein
MKFDVSNLTTDNHLPIVRGVVENKQISFFKRLWRFFSFKRKWEIIENYILWCISLQAFILLPKKFIYDGASVPKALGAIYSTIGVLYLGAGPHDLGYRYEGLFLIDPVSGELRFQKMSKKELDEIFNCLCTQETGMNIASGIARNTLSVFGISTWKKHRKINLKPENDFPDLFEEIKKEE